MGNKGQAILSEYVMIFFVVIAALMAMTVYMQRGLQGRVYDARNYMINSFLTSGACDDNCQRATGNISYEYEPYYTQTLSDVERNAQTDSRSTTGNPAVIGAIYKKTKDEKTAAMTSSTQLPPCASADPVPAWCH